MKDYTLNSTRNINYENSTKIINYPFSENEILYLQYIFLNNGIHYLNLEKKEFSEIIMSSILNSLNYYKSIGCLVENLPNLKNNFFDLLSILLEKNYLVNPNRDLITFFFNDFNFDFIYIEETQFFKKQKWYNFFKKYIFDLDLKKSLPIVFISFKN